MIDLTAAGLSPTEAKCYTALLGQKEWKPSDLAKFVGETRTNCYKVLDNLVALGLAERFDRDKKLHYRATNPSRLLELSRERRAAQAQAEKELEASASGLMANYFKLHEQPGVRYFQGKDGIKEVFDEIAAAREEVAFVHTVAGADFYGFDTMHNLRMLAVNNGVKRRALTPDAPTATKDYQTADPLVRLSRTWLQKQDYTAPVEWGAFDDKLYVISYGHDAMALMIQSRQIADSFKQLFRLLERGQRRLPDYDKLPREAKHKGVSDPQL